MATHYRSKDSAQGGIVSVQNNCGSEVIGTSPMYASEQERDAGLAAAKASGVAVTVRDNT